VNQARKFCEYADQTLGFAPLPFIERPTKQVVQLPRDCEVVLRQAGPHSKNNNSAIQIILQVGRRGEFNADVALQILAQVMDKPAFHELRTKQQLGYMVWQGVDTLENVQSIYFIIQSTIADPDELGRRIEAFLVQFRAQTLETLTSDEFDRYVESTIAMKLEKEKRQSSRTSRLWAEIASREFVWDRKQQEVAALRNLKKSDVLCVFDTFIAAEGTERRKCSSLVYGCEHSMPAVAGEHLHTSEKVRVVSDSVAFRNASELYPIGTIQPSTT
jgi:insulysin